MITLSFSRLAALAALDGLCLLLLLVLDSLPFTLECVFSFHLDDVGAGLARSNATHEKGSGWVSITLSLSFSRQWHLLERIDYFLLIYSQST